MPRKIKFMLGVVASSALLASCGGSSETPTPTPTATTPTPTPTSTATPTPLSFTEDFIAGGNGLYIYAYFTPTGGIETFSDASRVDAGGAINYAVNPEKVIFGFADLTANVEFLGTELSSASNTMRTYTRGDESLILELPFGNVMRGSYQRSDPFISATVPGTLRSNRVAIFANPITTTDAISTALSYTGQAQIVGGTSGTTTMAAITTPAQTFNIDPTLPAVSGTIQVLDSTSGTPTEVALLDFNQTTVGANGSFSSDVTDTANGFTGRYFGALAGPNREEIVFTFSVSHTDGRTYVGSFIGALNVAP